MSATALRSAPKNKSTRIPTYRLHKPTSQGYVELEGHRHYLGRYELRESREKYHRLVAEWLANGRRLRVDPQEITINELLNAYFQHCRSHVHVRPDGAISKGSLDSVRLALAPVYDLYGSVRAVEFGPLALRAVRHQWVEAGLRRTTINKRMGDVKRAFKWAVSMEMIPPAVSQALSTVEGLLKGRSGAKESRKVYPVPDAHIEAVRPYVSRQVWGLIQVQLLSGARSGEILRLRRIDLNTKGDVWTARIEHHKTSHKGKERTLYFGERAQAVLREFFPGKGPTDYLFSPAEAEAERRTEMHKERKTPLSCGNRPGTNKKEDPSVTPGDCYRPDTYRRAIQRACELADVPEWHPHRLRHSCATKLRDQFSLDAAAVFLGHSRADTTQIYAQLNAAQAVEIASKVG